MIETIAKLGAAIVPWVTLVGLIVHCYRDKKALAQKVDK